MDCRRNLVPQNVEAEVQNTMDVDVEEFPKQFQSVEKMNIDFDVTLLE